jgi:tetratricopeptide (TPR) repeat protein
LANFSAVSALTLASSSYFFAFFECVLITANLSPGYFNLGYSYYKEGYYKKAIDALKKVIEIKPDSLQLQH